jgi:hypothetical protein
MERLWLWGSFVALAAAAWGADVVTADSRAPAGEYDAALELKYDSGTHQYFDSWFTGTGNWTGNDFDLTTISDYRAITRARVYSCPYWPNNWWDGFHIRIFAYAGGRPGSLLWGPKYYKPARSGHGWCDCAVGWTLPPGNAAFVGALEQVYNYPDGDPFALDNNPTFQGHSWKFYRGEWKPLLGTLGYRNLMLRVVVNNVTVGVVPTSVGRVKALYY